MSELIGGHTSVSLLKLAPLAAKALGNPWNESLGVILTAISHNPDLSPTLSANTLDEWLSLWVTSYYKGWAQRISERVSSPPSTAIDPAVIAILHAKLPRLPKKKLAEIVADHRLAMSAENILGHLLEQYLADKLKPYGWHACWGQTIKSVDFVHADGRLLQVKNRSNSENSSSSKVRKGTAILKWYRSEAITGKTCWDVFPIALSPGSKILSEEDFHLFIHTVVTENPDALTLEESTGGYLTPLGNTQG